MLSLIRPDVEQLPEQPVYSTQPASQNRILVISVSMGKVLIMLHLPEAIPPVLFCNWIGMIIFLQHLWWYIFQVWPVVRSLLPDHMALSSVTQTIDKRDKNDNPIIYLYSNITYYEYNTTLSTLGTWPIRGGACPLD